MKRWLPYPLLSAFLLAMWLLLNRTLWPGHLLLGSAIALCGGLAFAWLQAPRGRLRRPRLILELAWLALTDIVRSNLAMARLVLVRGTRGVSSGFVPIPLELRHAGGLAVLACIITATPGTSWARYDAAAGVLTIHVLDLVEPDAWVETIRTRYERRLREILE